MVSNRHWPLLSTMLNKIARTPEPKGGKLNNYHLIITFSFSQA